MADDNGLQVHKLNLGKCCRICGSMFTAVKKSKSQYECSGLDRKSQVPFSELLQHVFQLYVEHDSPDVHPPNFCHKCYLVVRRWCVAQERKRVYKPAARGYEWLPHSSDCTFCKRFVGRGVSSKGKIQAKQIRHVPGADQENLSTRSTSDNSPSNEPSPLSDHSYANVPIYSQFLRPRKRKRCEEMSANKKLVLSTDDVADLKLSVGSPFSTDLCLTVPVPTNLQCGICQGILHNPLQTKCEHVFCEHCIKPWVSRFACCACCEELMSLRDLKPCAKHFTAVISSLPMKCVNLNCKVSLTVSTFQEHVLSCCAAGATNETVTVGTEEPESTNDTGPVDTSATDTPPSLKRGRPRGHLLDLNQPAQNSRLRTLKHAIQEHAESNGEELKDVYFALLLNHLRANKMWNEYHELRKLLSGKKSLDSRKCLAIRVSSFMSVTKYRRTQQETNHAVGFKVYQSYGALLREEKKYLPGSRELKFTLDPPLVKDITADGQSVDVSQTIPENFPEVGLPNIRVQQYHYDDAVAMMIEDIRSDIEEGLKNIGEDPNLFDHVMTVHIKDGCDGMGEVKCKQHKTTKQRLPDKVMRYSATLLKITCDDKIIFEEPKPNSQLNARPLLVSLADENDFFSVTTLLDILMEERRHMQNATLTIPNSHHGWKFQTKFYSTMYDEKLERKIVGLAGSSSEFLCTLCEATRSAAFSAPFQDSRITRTSHQNMERADALYTNDSSKTYKVLVKEARGVKSDSFTDITPHIDALHCEINSALWLKKLVVREIAGLTEKWPYKDAESKEKLKDAEEKFNEELRQGVRLQKHLMQPGNYSRQLTEPATVRIMLNLIPASRRGYVEDIFNKYNLMKTVWKASKPLADFPDLVQQYHNHAASFMNLLQEHFKNVKNNMPNYLHKLLVHVPQLITDYGSVGIYSSEANEHGNKLCRLFRKMNARQHTDHELPDIMKFHWLYTCKRLHIQLGQRRHQVCSTCNVKGHNMTSCARSKVV